MTFSTNSARPSEAEDWLDIEELIGELARRQNILISSDDPIFTTITLNDLVLARALQHQQAALVASQDEIAATTAQQIAVVQRLAERLLTAASEHLVTQVRTTIAQTTEQTQNATAADLREVRQIAAKAKSEGSVMRWGAGIAIAAATVFVTLVLVFPLLGSSVTAPECKPALMKHLVNAP